MYRKSPGNVMITEQKPTSGTNRESKHTLVDSTDGKN